MRLFGRFFETHSYKLATITNFYNLSISTSSAWFKYSVPSNGGSLIIESGIVVSKSTIPTVVNNNGKTIVKVKTLSFINEVPFIYNLDPSTYYYVRAYAINPRGIAYSDIITITTNSGIGFPTVMMDFVNNITETSADWQGYAANTAGGIIDERGFCWNTTGSPTKANNFVQIGSGNGSFNYTKTGMLTNTTYYVSAYAKNEAGTAYSNHFEFRTASYVPVVVLNSVSPLRKRGFDIFTNAELTGDSMYVVQPLGIGAFSIDLYGLNPSTNYWLRAFAVNSLIAGAEFNSTVNDGGSAITGRGCQFYTTSDCSGTPISVVEQSVAGTLSGVLGQQLQTDTNYYVRAWAQNAYNIGYSNIISFSTGDPTQEVTVTVDLVTPSTNSVLINATVEYGSGYTTDLISYSAVVTFTTNA